MATFGGCHTDGELCEEATVSTIGSGYHCNAYIPPDTKRATFTLRSFPDQQERNAQINVREFQRGAVMYDSCIVEEPDSGGGFGPQNGAYCGRSFRSLNCNPPVSVIYDFTPSRISFEEMVSDTWFCYLFDMGQWGGIVGTPCFHLEEESSATTGGSGADTTVAGTECHPCTGFTATHKEAICRYENPEGDETGDPDCPYPTMFGVGTLSNKIVFSYDAFSTVLPNGVTDVNFVYTPDSIDVDVWNQTEYSGLPVVTSQNPWKVGDEDDTGVIVIFEGSVLESGIKQGLRVKVRIQPVYDYDNAVWTGTKWTFMELMSPGQNYAVNDTYTLNYTHTHADLTTSVLTIDLKVTAVGPIEGTSPQTGFDALREGDTINGHTITKVFHTDFDNLQRHLVYLDGNGNDFTYNTQYTSNRAHQITVYAGKGIKTHSALLGLYEFYDKSVQFTTESIDGGSPDVYNTLKQPIAEGIISNGTITGFNVYSGGSGWDKLGAPPDLVCTTPALALGKEAELEIEIGNGAVSYIEVTKPGSGYTSVPPVTVSGNATAVAEIDSTHGVVNRIKITNHGSGYSANPTITVKGAGVITFDHNGAADASRTAGSYTGVSATGGDGSGATFDVVVDGSGVPTVTLNYEGQNYAKDNSLTITDALLGGGGASNIVINVTSVEDGAEAAGYWGDGVVVNITVKNQGSGYSATTDDPRAYIANVHRIDTLKITEGISEEDAGIEPHYNRLRTAGTFPEMVNAMDRTEDKAVDASRKKAYQSKSTTSPQPNSESLTDFSKNDIYTLPQRRYAKDKVDKYAEFILKYGVEGVNDVKDMTVKTSNVSPEYKKEMANYRKKTKEAEETRVQSIKTQVKALAQESVPEYLNYSGTLVETVQRRFSDLPHASTLTKYHMRQYRASSTDKMDIKVTIGCKLNESGCGHINCNAPAVSAGSTTNNNDGSTTTKTYTMSGLLGPGAEDWEATGTLRVLNDLTAATYNMGKCVEAYGNPFDI